MRFRAKNALFRDPSRFTYPAGSTGDRLSVTMFGKSAPKVKCTRVVPPHRGLHKMPSFFAPQSRRYSVGTAVTMRSAVRIGRSPVNQYGKATPMSAISPLILLYMSRYHGIGRAVRTS